MCAYRTAGFAANIIGASTRRDRYREARAPLPIPMERH